MLEKQALRIGIAKKEKNFCHKFFLRFARGEFSDSQESTVGIQNLTKEHCLR